MSTLQTRLPTDATGKVQLVVSANAVAPITAQNGLRIDAQGRVVIP